jgi:hypothetical protein
MRKFIVLLFFVALLGSLPTDKWNEMNQDERVKYANELSQPFMEAFNCSKIHVQAVQRLGIITIYGECVGLEM